MARAAQQAEDARRRAADDTARSRTLMDSLTGGTRMFMDRALGGTAAVAGVAAAGYQGYSRYGPWGASVARDSLAGPGTAALEAIGLSGRAALLRGAPGGPSGFYAAPMGFGDLLYEAGGGRALQALTGGVFGLDANRSAGFNPALVQSRARAELQLRFENIGSSMLQSLPFSNRTRFAFQGGTEDTQRLLAQQLSFIRSARIPGGEIGGLGFRANSTGIAGIAQGMNEELGRINRLRGYDLSEGEADELKGGALARFTPVELERAVQTGGLGSVRAKAQAAMKRLNELKQATNAELKDLIEFQSEVKKFFQGDSFDALMRPTVAFGGMNQLQAMRQTGVLAREGLSLGLRQGSAARYGRQQSTAALSFYESMVNGEIDDATARMYGGTGADAAFAFTARKRAYGLSVGSRDDGMRSLFYADPGAVSKLNSGGNYWSFLGAQANTAMQNPFAAGLSRYDPSTQERLANGGMYAAYSAATAEARATQMFLGKRGADQVLLRGLTGFQERTGISDNAEVRRLYDMYKERDDYFTSELGDKRRGRQASGLMEAMSNVAPGLRREAVLELMRSGEIKDGEDIGKMSTARLGELLVGFGGGGEEARSLRNDSSAFFRESRQWSVEEWASDSLNNARFAPTRTGDVQDQIQRLRQMGYSSTDINQRLKQAGAGTQFRVADDGTLQVWSSEGRKDGKQVFQNATGVSWADGSIGDDAQQRNSHQALMETLRGMSGSAVSQRSYANVVQGQFDSLGVAGDAFLQGLGGDALGDKIQNLLSGKATKLNKHQREFKQMFSDGQLTGKSLMAYGADDARSLLRQYYKGQKTLSPDRLSRINAATSEEDFNSLAAELRKANGDDDVQVAMATSFAARRRSELSTLAAGRGHSASNPLYVEMVPSGTGANLGTNGR
jgi:hypothetical protein